MAAAAGEEPISYEIFDPITAGKTWIGADATPEDLADLDYHPPAGWVPSTERSPLVHPNGGFWWQNDAQRARQKKVIMDMLKKAAGGVLRGEISLISLSIPVQLFEPRSHLERIVDSWVVAPYYLNGAADLPPIEQLKRTVAFCVTGLEFNCKQQKPFNPILGETYQARFADGTQVFCEQLAHHPPVSGYELFGPDDSYHLFGHGEWHASFSGNSVKGHQTGRSTIRFRNGTRIQVQWPALVIRGLIMGDRIIEYAREAVFTDLDNGLSAVLVFNPDATGMIGSMAGWFSAKKKLPADWFVGGVYSGPRDTSDPSVNRVAEIEGSWMGWCDIGGERIWDVNNPKLKPFRPIRVESPLASDCGYRLDVVRLSEGDAESSQGFKNELEVAQRQDEAGRKAGAKLRAKRK